jgi:superfamily II DNA or RNA helicase
LVNINNDNIIDNFNDIINDIINDITKTNIKNQNLILIRMYNEMSNITYVDLKNNGRIFPSWLLYNFKKYKLPELMRGDNEDPCNIQTQLKLHSYQTFISAYIGPNSPYNEILLFFNPGSGKTATAINVYNVLYNANPEINCIVLIKAALHGDPWEKDLNLWLDRDPNENGDIRKTKRFQNIYFVHYDSPYADKDFLETMKKVDTTKRNLYIIDEVHNFIRNVYSNINSKLGKRAQIIYDYIIQEKREIKTTKIVLISATPAINTPFELSLLFNLLRPGIFPRSELEFNQLFLSQSTYPILNPIRKNLFQRRIMGLVSYYIGSTPDLYAREELKYMNLEMSTYQYEIYQHYEDLEETISRKARMFRNSKSELYRSYTRQACNFVFPYVSIDINGELRPRPNKFKISDKIAEKVEEGKFEQLENPNEIDVESYLKELRKFVSNTEKYFIDVRDLNDDKVNTRTIFEDLDEFKNNYENYKRSFKTFYRKTVNKSKLLKIFYNSSPKLTAIIFYVWLSPGPVLIYSNYVYMEGLEMMKTYLKVIGYTDAIKSQAKKFFGYCEFHGGIDQSERDNVKKQFNVSENKYGELIKIIMLSPSGAEGINLKNIRQIHIIEPYWTEVRITQIIGRGIRQCSHKDLPMAERVVNVYRYKVVKPKKIVNSNNNNNENLLTADQIVEDIAKSKDNLIQSFLNAMKEVAVDCQLNQAHNMLNQSYNCFQFNEKTLINKNIGPAYREDIKDDLKFDNGLNTVNTKVDKIRVIKINAVTYISKDTYTKPQKYWYYPETGMVYDYELYFPVGRIKFDSNNLPNKLDKDTYIMSDVIEIPKSNF